MSLSAKPFITALCTWVVCFVAAALFGNKLPIRSETAAMFLTAILLIVLSIWFVAAGTTLKWHRTTYLTAGVIGLLLVALFAKPFTLRSRIINTAAYIPGEVVLTTISHAAIPASLISEGVIQVRNSVYITISDYLETCYPESTWGILFLAIAQLILASGVGLWIGCGIDKASHLLPIALVAALADVWSVSAGATAMIIRSEQINYFLVRFPLLGGPKAEVPYLIGLTDFLFFGIFYQAALRFDLGNRKNLALLSSSFVIAVAAALLFRVGLPVLPFMGVLFIIGNWRQLHLTREETKQMLLFLAAILLVFGITSYYLPAMRGD